MTTPLHKTLHDLFTPSGLGDEALQFKMAHTTQLAYKKAGD